MIKGQQKVNTEQDYRAIGIDSSSSLKDFSLDRKKYFRKYIMNEVVREEDTQASLMGKLVETLLMEPELFDERFYMSACMSEPTGLMLAFVEALYRLTVEATDDSGQLTTSFDELMRDAYAESGFKIKYEAVVSKFVGSDAEIYYEEIRKVRSKNMSVATADDVSNAEKIVAELKSNFVTADIVNQVSSIDFSVMNQMQVEGFKLFDHPMKAMMDKVIVNHKEQTIQVYDLKCVWAVENFYEEYYLYRRAYIQAYVYWIAAHQFALDNGIEHFKILPPRFIVCDSINYYNPLIYELTEQDLLDARTGFTYKYRSYPGVEQIVEELNFAMDNNIWNMSKDNYKNKGIVKLK